MKSINTQMIRSMFDETDNAMFLAMSEKRYLHQTKEKKDKQEMYGKVIMKRLGLLLLPLLFLFQMASMQVFAQQQYIVELDGTNDYITADGLASDLAASDWTVELWFRYDVNSTAATPIFAINTSSGATDWKLG